MEQSRRRLKPIFQLRWYILVYFIFIREGKELENRLMAPIEMLDRTDFRNPFDRVVLEQIL